MRSHVLTIGQRCIDVGHDLVWVVKALFNRLMHFGSHLAAGGNVLAARVDGQSVAELADRLLRMRTHVWRVYGCKQASFVEI